jgi:hypothetical protein
MDSTRTCEDQGHMHQTFWNDTSQIEANLLQGIAQRMTENILPLLQRVSDRVSARNGIDICMRIAPDYPLGRGI